MRLTDISIKALKPPEQGAVIFYDDTLSGFGVRVSEGGTRSFVLTHGPRRQRTTLGRVGVVTLQEARTEAKKRLAEHTLGRQDTPSVSWNIALDEYLLEIKAKRKPRTHLDYERLLNKHFRYGVTKLSDLSPQDIQKSLARLCDTPAEHQHAFVVLRAYLRWTHRKHYTNTNPMERMQAPHRYKPRARVLTDGELKRVWNAAGEGTFGQIVKLLILTGQRRGEIAGLTGGMIDGDTITLPPSLTKNSREHRFPLSALSSRLLPPRAPSFPEALFFSARGRTHQTFNGWSKCKMKLDEVSGVSEWTLHDLRRTFASGLASLGVQLPVVERLLNHVSGSFAGIVGVYQRYDYFPEMRAAIHCWEDHIVAILKD